MDLGAHPGAQVGNKGGRKEIRTDGINKMGSGPIREKGPYNCIDQRLTSVNRCSTTGETKSRNACESTLEIWSWKYRVGIAGEIMVNTQRGPVVLEKFGENCLTKVAPANQERDHENLLSEGRHPLSGVDATIWRWTP